MSLILGVVTLENSDYPPFGKQTTYFEELSSAASITHVELQFFSPVNWQKTTNLCKGYSYKNKQWSFTVFELPLIIYDRTFGSIPILSEFRNYLEEGKYKVLNPLNLSRLLSNKIKFQHFLLEHHIPTLEAFSLNELNDDFFQEEQASYYLKPVFGKGGADMFVLEKNAKHFVLKLDADNSISFKNCSLLFSYFKKHFKDKRYLIQAKAKLSYLNNRPFDIRVLLQNEGINNYSVTGYGVRVGKENSFVSNLNAGGTVLPLEAMEDHYKQYHHKKLEEEMKNIFELCKQCCTYLHNSYGNFLEIAFDILLTLDRGPIILEANSKPSRWR